MASLIGLSLDYMAQCAKCHYPVAQFPPGQTVPRALPLGAALLAQRWPEELVLGEMADLPKLLKSDLADERSPVHDIASGKLGTCVDR